MDVSIIIVNYNTKDLLFNCLDSIQTQTKEIDYEIIVFDNASNDGSIEMIKKEFPNIKLIKSNKNLGFGKANNLAAKTAKGKYLFLLNSDTKLRNNIVKIFFDFAEKHREFNIGAIGAILLDENLNVIHSFGYLPSFLRDVWFDLKTSILNLLGRTRYLKIKKSLKDILRLKKRTYSNQNTFFEVEYVTGADMFIKKEDFNLFGGFDPNYFMYFEESDLQYRMQNSGFKNIIITESQLIHFEGASFKYDKRKTDNNKRFYQDESRFYYYKKNKSKFIYYLYRTTYTLIQLLTMIDLSYKFNDRINYIGHLITLKTKKV